MPTRFMPSSRHALLIGQEVKVAGSRNRISSCMKHSSSRRRLIQESLANPKVRHASREICSLAVHAVALRFVFLTQQQRLNCVDIIISTPVRLPLPGCLSTVPNFTSRLLMLFFVQPLFSNFVINCRALCIIRADFKILYSLLNGVKVGAFCLIIASKFVISIKATRKNETCNVEYFYQMSSKSILIAILSYTVPKFIFETQCIVVGLISDSS